MIFIIGLLISVKDEADGGELLGHRWSNVIFDIDFYHREYTINWSNFLVTKHK